MQTYTKPDVGFKVYDRVKMRYVSSPLGEFITECYDCAMGWAIDCASRTGRPHIVYHSSFKAGART